MLFLKVKNTAISLSLIGILILTIMGLIKVNIINSKTLSPLGQENIEYNLDQQKMYESYSSFIKDNSLIKIYEEDASETLIKIGDKNFKITRDLDIQQYTKNILEKIEVFLSSL